MHKYNLRDELIISLMNNKGVEKDPFVSATIKNRIKDIPDSKLQSFFESVAEADSFGDGLKVIMKIAEQFNPKPLEPIIDATTAEAKRLISACETMNTILFKECNNIGVPFEDYVMDYEFNNLQDSTKGLLSAVKPYSDYKRLIVNIRRYQTSSDALNAFKQAIIQVGKNEYAMIENKKVSGMIGGIKNETTHNF